MKLYKILLITCVLFGLSLSIHSSIHAQTVTPPNPPITADLYAGLQGEQVASLQQFLQNLSFFTYPTVTGYYGAFTRAAVVAFQNAHGIQPVGAVGPITRAKIVEISSSVVSTTTPEIKPSVRRRGGVRSSHRTSSGDTASYTLTVSMAGTGSGTVSSSPAGISCAGVCSETYEEDTSITLTATAASGSTFTGWSGGGCSGTGTCVVNMTTAYTVSATFDIATYTVTLSGTNITPSGARTVSHGSTQSFTVTSGTGYGLGTIGGTCPAGSWVHATYTTGPVTSSCSVSFTPATVGTAIGSMIATTEDIFLRQNGSDFEYSLNGSEWDSSLMPSITNVGDDTITVHLLGDFTVSSANSYIVIDSDNITIQGETGKEGPTIVTVDGVDDYPGFIQNGTMSTSGYNDVTISDVFVNVVDSTLAQYGGWLAQAYFGIDATNVTIDSCGSNGPISANSGGVLGAHAIGVTISDCFTTGDMAINSGGIVGSWADSVTVQNAHSSGLIGFSAGGIFGGSTFDSIANNTYSTGLIYGDAGGIFGESHSNPTVTHSYTSGSKFSSGAGILSGSSSDGVGNYSESNNSSSGWNTTHAASVMTGINTVWKLIQVNYPYRLLSFNASPYDDATQTISAGESSDAVFGYYTTCDIASISGGDAGSYADITIDADTGVVSITNAVQDGTYNIVVSCDTLHDTYTLSTLELTVN